MERPECCIGCPAMLRHDCRLQAICTRVGTDGSCDLIIEDGTVKDTEKQSERQWKAGEF